MPVLKRWNGTAWDVVGAADSANFVTGYYSDLPPEVANAGDDEFNDGVIGSAWTEWDPGAKHVFTEDDYGVKVTTTGSAGTNSFGGLYRALPVGDFSVTTKVDLTATYANGPGAGIIIAADLTANPTTADFHFFGLGQNPNAIGLYLYNDYLVFNSTVATVTISVNYIYLRVARISTQYFFDYSFDGVAWTRFNIALTPAYTVASIGIASNNFVATTSYPRFRFWRQSSNTSVDTPLSGRVLTRSLTQAQGLTGPTPDDIPTNPTAEDYEFNSISSSLPTGWSWVNQGTSTYSENAGAGTLIAQPRSGTYDWRQIVRSIPSSSSWTATMKLIGVGPNTGTGYMASALLRQSSDGKFVTLDAYRDGNVYSARWTSVNIHSSTTAGPVAIATNNGSVNRTYFRIRRNSATSYDFYISPDGRAWYPVLLANNVSAFMTPDQIGFGTSVESTYGAVSCDWIRFT